MTEELLQEKKKKGVIVHTVSCILSKDRDIFGLANSRDNLGLNIMYIDPLKS